MQSAARTGRAPVLSTFVNQWTVLLTTYRRDGTPVPTPMNIAVDKGGSRAFIRTWETSWKFKRILNNPVVEIAPCTVRGKPTGPAMRFQARILNGVEAEYAAQAINRKYPIFQGILVRLAHRLRGYKTRHIEVTPVEDFR